MENLGIWEDCKAYVMSAPEAEAEFARSSDLFASAGYNSAIHGYFGFVDGDYPGTHLCLQLLISGNIDLPVSNIQFGQIQRQCCRSL